MLLCHSLQSRLNVSDGNDLSPDPLAQRNRNLEAFPVTFPQHRQLPNPNQLPITIDPIDTFRNEELRHREVERMREHVNRICPAELDVEVNGVVWQEPSARLRMPVGHQILRPRRFQIAEPAHAVLETVVLNPVTAQDEIRVYGDGSVHEIHSGEVHVRPVSEPLRVLLDDLRDNVVPRVPRGIETLDQGLPVHICTISWRRKLGFMHTCRSSSGDAEIRVRPEVVQGWKFAIYLRKARRGRGRRDTP